MCKRSISWFSVLSLFYYLGLSFHPMAGNSDSDTDDEEEPKSKCSKSKEPGLDSGCRSVNCF